jgi:hypothetical protein
LAEDWARFSVVRIYTTVDHKRFLWLADCKAGVACTSSLHIAITNLASLCDRAEWAGIFIGIVQIVLELLQPVSGLKARLLHTYISTQTSSERYRFVSIVRSSCNFGTIAAGVLCVVNSSIRAITDRDSVNLLYRFGR